MVIDTLKKILPITGKGYPKPFHKILEYILEKSNPTEKEINQLWKAYNLSKEAHEGQMRRSGEPYFNHCIEVGNTLAEWHLDTDAIIAGLLHDTIEDTEITEEKIIKEFGKEIASLVEGVTNLSGIKFNSRQHKQAENFMKMFLSVASDIRVIIIKFADRLHNMRTIKHLPLIKQRRIAIETRDVYAPLAHRLGMWKLKAELEDLVFETLEPATYKALFKKVKSSKKDLQKSIDNFKKPILVELETFNIECTIFGRSKHYNSIYEKMEKQNKEFSEIFDFLALRIIVGKIEECYAVLGIVHQLYTPIQERFKDFIATPKTNGYQSIHTTVFGKGGKMFEVQIRTKEMDRTAEIGVAAHWAYKENTSYKTTKKGINKHVNWLRELVEALQNENKNPDEFLNLLKIDLYEEEIFVFTPRGDVNQLQADSTPVDFAFQVHSQVGFNCIGAKVNGKIVPLNTQLKSGDTIEILTSENQTPSYAWLKFVQTAKAKTHIKRWVKKQQTEQSITLGKEILEKALRRLKNPKLIMEITEKPNILGYNSVDLIYTALASGQLTVREIINKYIPNEDGSDSIANEKDDETLTSRFLRKARGIAKGVVIDGISNAMITFGKCCNPIPGDKIVGYITRGRGITVHRGNCNNLPVLKDEDRFLNVEWDVRKNESFIVRLKIIGEDRKHFLKDITESISGLNINLVSVDISANEGVATGIFILQVRDTRQLERITKKLKLIKGIIDLLRM